jgi:hypothetical protein
MAYKDPPKEHRFSSTNQPPNESKRVPKTSSKIILERFLSIEKKMINPLSGVEEYLSMAEIMHLKQLANAIQGDLASYKEILDRFEGKSASKQEEQKEEGNEGAILNW